MPRTQRNRHTRRGRALSTPLPRMEPQRPSPRVPPLPLPQPPPRVPWPGSTPPEWRLPSRRAAHASARAPPPPAREHRAPCRARRIGGTTPPHSAAGSREAHRVSPYTTNAPAPARTARRRPRGRRRWRRCSSRAKRRHLPRRRAQQRRPVTRDLATGGRRAEAPAAEAAEAAETAGPRRRARRRTLRGRRSHSRCPVGGTRASAAATARGPRARRRAPRPCIRCAGG